jgi:hypothetical protein
MNAFAFSTAPLSIEAVDLVSIHGGIDTCRMSLQIVALGRFQWVALLIEYGPVIEIRIDLPISLMFGPDKNVACMRIVLFLNILCSDMAAMTLPLSAGQ